MNCFLLAIYIEHTSPHKEQFTFVIQNRAPTQKFHTPVLLLVLWNSSTVELVTCCGLVCTQCCTSTGAETQPHQTALLPCKCGLLMMQQRKDDWKHYTNSGTFWCSMALFMGIFLNLPRRSLWSNLAAILMLSMSFWAHEFTVGLTWHIWLDNAICVLQGVKLSLLHSSWKRRLPPGVSKWISLQI